jgi:hypothetical protein
MNASHVAKPVLAYAADSAAQDGILRRTVDHEVNVIQSRTPAADAGMMREVGEYKALMQSSGQQSSACRNCGVTSAVRSMNEMLADKTGGAGQQDANAGSTGS